MNRCKSETDNCGPDERRRKGLWGTKTLEPFLSPNEKERIKGVLLSLSISTALVSVVAIFLNAYLAFPMYSSLYGIPMEAILEMGVLRQSAGA